MLLANLIITLVLLKMAVESACVQDAFLVFLYCLARRPLLSQFTPLIVLSLVLELNYMRPPEPIHH